VRRLLRRIGPEERYLVGVIVQLPVKRSENGYAIGNSIFVLKGSQGRGVRARIEAFLARQHPAGSFLALAEQAYTFPHRAIFSTELLRSADNEELVFTVRGRSFLRYMVRKMVGTLLDVGRGKLAPTDIDRLYELRDRSKSGPTVPSQGLVMVEVQHDEAWRIGKP